MSGDEDDFGYDLQDSTTTSDGKNRSEKMTKKAKKNSKKDNEESESSRIAKNMFNETKLSMTVFETFDIDELLSSVNNREEKLSQNDCKTPKTSNNINLKRNILNNDESIMRKLTDMSQNFTVPSAGDAAAANDATTSTSSSNLHLLNSHEIDLRRLPRGIDGNSIPTRRIDLRTPSTESQNQQPGAAAASNSNNPTEDSKNSHQPSIESLLKNLLNTMSLNRDNGFDLIKNEKLSVSSSESSSDSSTESDEDDDESGRGRNELWIERYRKQKQAQK